MSDGRFPESVRRAAKERATRDGVICCEGCGEPAVGLRVDHKRARGLYGPGTLENAQVLGRCCWREKDAADNRIVKRCVRIAKAQDAPRPQGTIRSRGFAKRVKLPRPPSAKIVPRRNIGA